MTIRFSIFFSITHFPPVVLLDNNKLIDLDFAFLFFCALKQPKEFDARFITKA